MLRPMKTTLALATLTTLLLNVGLAAAQTTPTPAVKTCNANFGWWESTGLMPVFSGESGTPQVVDCNFQVWSWTAFVNAMQTDPNSKQPVFLSYPTYDDLKQGGGIAGNTRGPRKLVLKPREVTREIPFDLLAGSFQDYVKGSVVGRTVVRVS